MQSFYSAFTIFQLMPVLSLAPVLLLPVALRCTGTEGTRRPVRLVAINSGLWLAYGIWEYRVQLWAVKKKPLRIFQQCLVAVLMLIQATAFAGEMTRIAVISDINGRYGSSSYHPRLAAAIARIIELDPEIVISTGDMIAGQQPSPKLTRPELDAMWQSFHRQVRIPLEQAGIPVIMTPGNHDASAYPGYELEREAYSDYHLRHLPTLSPLPGGQFPYYFALARDNFLLVSLDATRSGPLDQAQVEWLAKLLAQYEKETTILFGHLPLQPFAQGRERDIVTDPKLEALLAANDITAYMSGHHHAWYPGHRLGTAMLSMGNLGGNQRSLVGTNQKTGFSFALLELDSDGIHSISAYSAPDYRCRIADSSLPEYLGTGPGQLIRLDRVTLLKDPKSDAGHYCPASRR